jgi:hypothetical protein
MDSAMDSQETSNMNRPCIRAAGVIDQDLFRSR